VKALRKNVLASATAATSRANASLLEKQKEGKKGGYEAGSGRVEISRRRRFLAVLIAGNTEIGQGAKVTGFKGDEGQRSGWRAKVKGESATAPYRKSTVRE
jgi:hypothetical protein